MSRVVLGMRAAAFVVLAVLFVMATGARQPALAATLTASKTALCDYTLSGVIEPGDAAKLQKALAAHKASSAVDLVSAEHHGYGSFPRICLRSDGGSFNEALKIIDAIAQARSVVTMVEANQSCFSACALIFLAGQYGGGDGYLQPMRFMHVTAKIGFHAPAISAGSQNFDAKTAEQFYRGGVQAIAKLLEKDTRLYPKELLTRALQVEPNSFLMVSRVEHAARWNIGLYGYKVPVIANEGDLENMCDLVAHAKWQTEDISSVERPAKPGKPFQAVVGRLQTRTFEGYGEGGVVCTVGIGLVSDRESYVAFSKFERPKGTGGGELHVHIGVAGRGYILDTWGDEFTVPIWYAHDPLTPLASLYDGKGVGSFRSYRAPK
jgi:ATP-dependent protease ClpP protease subunit